MSEILDIYQNAVDSLLSYTSSKIIFCIEYHWILFKFSETEEGFVKLFSKKLSVEDDDELHCGEGVVNTPADELDPRRPTFQNLRHVLKVRAVLVL